MPFVYIRRDERGYPVASTRVFLGDHPKVVITHEAAVEVTDEGVLERIAQDPALVIVEAPVEPPSPAPAVGPFTTEDLNAREESPAPPAEPQTGDAPDDADASDGAPADAPADSGDDSGDDSGGAAAAAEAPKPRKRK